MSHFCNSFILSYGTSTHKKKFLKKSCGMSWYGNLLFYFDLYATNTLVIVKNIVTTPKCHNIFTKALFPIVVSLGLIVYYILFWSEKTDTSTIIKILWQFIAQV